MMFTINMDLKSALEKPTETTSEHLSIPCKPTQKKRYKAISQALRDRKKLDLFTEECRKAADSVMDTFESLLVEMGVALEHDEAS